MLGLFYPPVELAWQVTNYSGEAVEFSISEAGGCIDSNSNNLSLDESSEEEEEMTAEITVTAEREDKMLTVSCSLVLQDLSNISAQEGNQFRIDKFMQFDVQCEFITSQQADEHARLVLRHAKQMKIFGVRMEFRITFHPLIYF